MSDMKRLKAKIDSLPMSLKRELTERLDHWRDRASSDLSSEESRLIEIALVLMDEIVDALLSLAAQEKSNTPP